MTKSKTIAGIKYIIGENALENHSIIREAGENDWWFHLDNTESGHCIVKSDKINYNIMIIAGNYVKKYSKQKKLNKVNICYTQIKNIIIMNTPGLVEFKHKINTFECYSTKIYHCSDYNGGNASEYIIPAGNIDITSHAIGSGIYGLTKQCKNAYTFNLENPYILENNDQCDNYIRASLFLNSNINDSSISINYILNKFCYLLPEFKESYVLKKLKEFKSDYKNRKDMVMMPINYIFMGYNYDGIYSRNTIMDNLNKGNIKFTNYPTKKNKLDVIYFKKRNRINSFTIKYN